MKKIILFFILLSTGYGITVFIAPEVSSKLEEIVGLSGLTEKIHGGKKMFDGIVTDIPSIDEVVDGYESALSGARDVKNTLSDGVETTKATIDTVRGGAQKAEETYNEAIETIDSAKQTFEDLSGKVGEIGEVVESVNNLTGGEK